METSQILLMEILQILSRRYGTNYTLEELTCLLFPVLNVAPEFRNFPSIELENQARVLEGLIVLNDQGFIFLDAMTDKSSITVKGLMEVNNKVFCN